MMLLVDSRDDVLYHYSISPSSCPHLHCYSPLADKAGKSGVCTSSLIMRGQLPTIHLESSQREYQTDSTPNRDSNPNESPHETQIITIDKSKHIHSRRESALGKIPSLH